MGVIVECPGIVDRILARAAELEKREDLYPVLGPGPYSRETWRWIHHCQDRRDTAVRDLLAIAEVAEGDADRGETLFREWSLAYIRGMHYLRGI